MSEENSNIPVYIIITNRFNDGEIITGDTFTDLDSAQNEVINNTLPAELQTYKDANPDEDVDSWVERTSDNSWEADDLFSINIETSTLHISNK